MNRRRIARILGVALVSASADIAAQDAFQLRAEQIPGFLAPGVAGVVVADFDHDGRDDVAITGLQSVDRYTSGDETPQSGLIIVVRYDTASASYQLAQTLVSDMPRLAGIAKDGAAAETGLVAVSRDGIVAHYVGWPLTMVSHVALGRPVASMRVGDVDGDGRIEVVVADPIAGMAAYDLDSGALKHSYDARFTASIEIAQLDADPALEIVMAGTPGLVVDGATNATDWQDAGGFGPMLAAGHILADHGEGFVAAQTWDFFSAYRGWPYSPIWSVKAEHSSGVDTADIDGDGIDEILYSGYYGPFAVVDALTQSVRLQAPYAPMGHMGAARMHGTPAWQFAFGEILNYSGGDTAEIITEQGDVDFALHEESAPFSVTAADDIDGDGAADAVWISAYTDARYAGGKIHVYDPVSGVERWQGHLSFGGVELIYDSLSAVALARLRASAPADIVVADEGVFTGAEIRVVDGSTREVTLSNVDTGFTHTINRLAIIDGATGPQILATAIGSPIEIGLFDGGDLHALWHDTLDESFGEDVNDLQRLSDDGGAHVFLLAAQNALVAYDVAARHVAWSRAAPTVSAAVLHLADGTPVIGALGESGNLALLTTDGATTLADFPIGESEPGAVRDLAGEPGKAIACIDRRVVEIDLDAQVVTAQSPWIGGLACGNGNLAVASLSGGKTHIRAGSLAGVFDLDLAGEEIFRDGFDGGSGH